MKKIITLVTVVFLLFGSATLLTQAVELEESTEPLSIMDQSEQVAFIPDSPEYVVIRDGNLYKGYFDDSTGDLDLLMTGASTFSKNPIAGYTVYGNMPSEVIDSSEFPYWLSVCYLCGDIECLYMNKTLYINNFQIAECNRVPSAYTYVYKGENNLVFDVGDEDLVWTDDVHYDHDHIHFGERIAN